MAQRDADGLSIDVLEAFYRRTYGRFMRVALAIVGDRDLARDVVQDAFAQALRARRSFRGNGDPEAWVWAIVVNTARSNLRRQLDVLGNEVREVAASNGRGGEWPDLRAAVAALPERQRLAIFLRHYADMDYEQIADVLEISRGTVAASLHAAHAALRKQMSEVPR